MSVGDYIPNSWVMFTGDIYQPLKYHQTTPAFMNTPLQWQCDLSSALESQALDGADEGIKIYQDVGQSP